MPEEGKTYNFTIQDNSNEVSKLRVHILPAIRCVSYYPTPFHMARNNKFDAYVVLFIPT